LLGDVAEGPALGAGDHADGVVGDVLGPGVVGFETDFAPGAQVLIVAEHHALLATDRAADRGVGADGPALVAVEHLDALEGEAAGPDVDVGPGATELGLLPVGAVVV